MVVKQWVEKLMFSQNKVKDVDWCKIVSRSLTALQ